MHQIPGTINVALSRLLVREVWQPRDSRAAAKPVNSSPAGREVPKGEELDSKGEKNLPLSAILLC